MGKFNQELVKTGVMLAGEGLHPSSKRKRVSVRGRSGDWQLLPRDNNDLVGRKKSNRRIKKTQ